MEMNIQRLATTLYYGRRIYVRKMKRLYYKDTFLQNEEMVGINIQ